MQDTMLLQSSSRRLGVDMRGEMYWSLCDNRPVFDHQRQILISCKRCLDSLRLQNINGTILTQRPRPRRW